MPERAVAATLGVIGPDNWQTVRWGRSMTHPFIDPIILDIGQQLSDLPFQQREWRGTGTKFQPAELDNARRAYAPVHRSDDEFARRDHHGRTWHGRWIDQFDVISPLAFQRHLDAQLVCDGL